jgi:hypothetical protein
MIKNQRKNTFFIITFFLITLLFKPLWLFNNQNLGIPGDDMSYWLHSATIAIDYDLDYKNDYKLESSVFNPETNVPSHPPGAGYIASPFVFLFSQLDKVINLPVENTRTNPVKSFAYLGFFVSGLFYTYIGTKLLSKIVKKYNNNYTGLIIFCGLLSTLIHYVSTRFLMAHAIEFFLCCSLIYIFEKDEGKNLSSNHFTILLLIYFCLAITRPSTFLYSLILILFYRKIFILNGRSVLSYIIQLLGFSSIYVLLSRKLYQKNFMFLNTYGSDINEYSATLNFEQLFGGLQKLPYLFFSPNMGITFSTPIIFLALIVCFTKETRTNLNISDKLFMFLFFGSSAIPLLIWQGREVAYGQRLLVGIVPMCILITCKYLFDKRLVFLTKLLTLITYVGYLMFYSSEKLTLKPGTTLWGTQTGFTAENYYIEVVKGLLDYETILSSFLRNIYSVDIFKFINLRNLINDSMLTSYLSIGKVEKFLSFTDVYFGLDVSYLLIVNLSIIVFCYFYTKLLFSFSK